MIPRGYCQCGCGGKTSLATQNSPALGYMKGEPKFYLSGHQRRGRHYLSEPYREEDRGHSTPCWIWQGSINSLWGYGNATKLGKSYRAHKLFYERHVGQVPAGLQLDHLCRVRACVNPEHLEPVTPAENARRSSATLLTAEEVRMIKQRLREGRHGIVSQLASEFGVSVAAISNIKVGKTWKDVG